MVPSSKEFQRVRKQRLSRMRGSNSILLETMPTDKVNTTKEFTIKILVNYTTRNRALQARKCL